MTRRRRLACVQKARRHFIWRCLDWNRVSFSGETRFALSSAGGKAHKQMLLERDRFVGGRFVVLGGKKRWLEDVLCCHARQFQYIILTTFSVLMPYHFSIIFTHKKIEVIFGINWKQTKKAIECNVFFMLSFLKGVDILSWKEIDAMCR